MGFKKNSIFSQIGHNAENMMPGVPAVHVAGVLALLDGLPLPNVCPLCQDFGRESDELLQKNDCEFIFCRYIFNV
jgi:hypothetical protein